MRSRASALRERLVPRASDASNISSLDDPRAAARFLGLAYAAGATLAIASMAFPQPPGTDVTGLFGIYAVALAVGGYLLLRGSRVTAKETSGALLIGTVLVSLAIHFTDQRTGVYSLFYVWIAIESVYFLSRGAALFQVVVVAVAFGLVLMSERPPGAEEQWVITVGTVALAGILVGALKANVERLIGRLAAAAHTDPLTGLSNRRAFQDAVEVELERARRGQRPVSLLVADLDHFKRVNDLLGHPSGDQVLKQFAAQMTRLTRTIDIPARLGGEEFAIVLARGGQARRASGGRAAPARGEGGVRGHGRATHGEHRRHVLPGRRRERRRPAPRGRSGSLRGEEARTRSHGALQRRGDRRRGSRGGGHRGPESRPAVRGPGACRDHRRP